MTINATVRDFNDKPVTVKVGDWVGFKADIEQSGQITNITQDRWQGAMLTLANPDGFIGGYIGGQRITTQAARDCWVE